MKKYTYSIENLDELYHEQVKEKFPKHNIVQKAQYLTPDERLELFTNIINQHGEKGWQYQSILRWTPDGRVFIIFVKEVYK